MKAFTIYFDTDFKAYLMSVHAYIQYIILLNYIIRKEMSPSFIL